MTMKAPNGRKRLLTEQDIANYGTRYMRRARRAFWVKATIWVAMIAGLLYWLLK
jgi:hypothetical protein